MSSGIKTYIVGTEEGRVYTFTKEYGYSYMYTNLTIGSDKIVAVDIS